ncbi:hypothetical protein, partial [Agathobaculum sp.]|uniref:hypothetical protein n=1 Tax=Agathobaculum sp. TaxID=2048138 RepID=UPI0027BAB4DC
IIQQIFLIIYYILLPKVFPDKIRDRPCPPLQSPPFDLPTNHPHKKSPGSSDFLNPINRGIDSQWMKKFIGFFVRIHSDFHGFIRYVRLLS